MGTGRADIRQWREKREVHERSGLRKKSEKRERRCVLNKGLEGGPLPLLQMG